MLDTNIQRMGKDMACWPPNPRSWRGASLGADFTMVTSHRVGFQDSFPDFDKHVMWSQKKRSDHIGEHYFIFL